MQARELTPDEVAEGSRNINERQLSATEVQALVRRMDASKAKWKRLKQQGKAAEYEESLKKENQMLYFNYPSLFDMHKEDRLDATFFELLSLKRRIEKGEVSPEEASRVVGPQLFNRFVPQADVPPPAPRMSYEEFYKQESLTPHTGGSTPEQRG
jgi:hypothetical protein